VLLPPHKFIHPSCSYYQLQEMKLYKFAVARLVEICGRTDKISLYVVFMHMKRADNYDIKITYRITGFLDFFHRQVFLGVETRRFGN
jgi:hypothetical protein